MNYLIGKFTSLPFKYHLFISALFRIILILYGEFHDSVYTVKYTDVDYRVITDGAQHVLNNDSPYKRHTYRYTPILAYLVLPNLIVHKSFGKLLFSIFDLLVGIFIYKIIYEQFKQTFISNSDVISKKFKLKKTLITVPIKYHNISKYCSLFWLYNPMTMAIATRGNSDSLTSLLVLISLYFLLKSKQNYLQFLLSGIFHGLAIHFRLYPIIFSLPYYLTISNYQKNKNFLISILFPNLKQILLVFGTVITLFVLTSIFYIKYEYKFLYESLIYHLIRKDTAHNFSLFFYMQYLLSGNEIVLSFMIKILTFLPQFIVLTYLCFTFGYHRKSLPFCLFAQAFTIVIYNPVVTSQYFIWFLSLLPLCLSNFKKLTIKSGYIYFIIWILGQCGWLLPAYMLEFKGWNTFDFIWLQGILFFSCNIYILQRLIINFNVISDFKTHIK